MEPITLALRSSALDDAVARLALYAVLIIVTMAILEWRESRRSRSRRERLHTRRPESLRERTPVHEKRTA